MAFVVGCFFSARAVIGLLAVRALGLDARGGSGISLTLNFLLLVLVAFHSLGAPKCSSASLTRSGTVRWVIFFLGFSGLSLAWSVSASIPAAILYWCALAADVLMVAILVRAGCATTTTISLMKGFVWTSCLAALLAWVMPAGADLRLGDKEFFNPNQIGFLCALAFYFQQYLMRSKAGDWRLAAVLLGVTLLRSLSKTTILAFALSQLGLLIHDRSIRSTTRRWIALSLGMLLLVFWGLFTSYYDTYTSAGNQAETLTGRTAIWAYVLQASLDHPWIGHGFDSMWKVVPPLSDDFEPRHAENELLQQFYTYGIVGIGLFLGLYSSLYRRVQRRAENSLRPILLSLLWFILIRGLAEAEPFDFQLPLWSILLLGMTLDEGSSVLHHGPHLRVDAALR